MTNEEIEKRLCMLEKLMADNAVSIVEAAIFRAQQEAKKNSDQVGG